MLLWCSVTIYYSYINIYYNKLINLCESVGASFTKWEFAHRSLTLGKQEMPEIGSLPGSFIFTESEPRVRGIPPKETNISAKTTAEPLAPGPTAEKVPVTSGEHSPSPPSTVSEEARTKGGTPEESI
ncbi:unnamed protein product [Tuber aestivum]|uniref:Uncharacterized protein n=1 Tax=Tuber aestivum TaxID=59557 RepID=A0A292PSA4_9PEZI|nr:unnamed protein product [Tuber aestivum]